MGDGSLTFKYWIEFDDEGEIKAFHKTKYECENPSEEFIVKLIPIKRDVFKDVEQSADKLNKVLEQQTKKLNTEFNKVLKDLKGVLR